MRTFKVQQQRRKGQLGGSNLASKMQFLDFIYLDAILPPAESKGFFFCWIIWQKILDVYVHSIDAMEN